MLVLGLLFVLKEPKDVGLFINTTGPTWLDEG